MILKFEDDYVPLAIEDYPGEPQDREAFLTFLDELEERIGRSKNPYIDSWERRVLGYVGMWSFKDDEVPLQKRLTDEEKDWIFEELPKRSIDTRSVAWSILENLGAIRADIEFSGGGDEGGTDRIVLTLGDGSTKELYEWPRDGQELTEEETTLISYITQPVYEKYHGFAGEFSVHGTVVWDVAARKVLMNGEESVQQYEGFSEEV